MKFPHLLLSVVPAIESDEKQKNIAKKKVKANKEKTKVQWNSPICGFCPAQGALLLLPTDTTWRKRKVMLEQNKKIKGEISQSWRKLLV